MNKIELNTPQRDYIQSSYDKLYQYYCKGNSHIGKYNLQRVLQYFNHILSTNSYSSDDKEKIKKLLSLYVS